MLSYLKSLFKQILSPVLFASLATLQLAATNVGEEEHFHLSKGKKNIAGKIWFPLKVDRHGKTHVGINLEPSYGFFFRKQLELRFNLMAETNHVISGKAQVEAPPFFWGASVTSLYFFKTHTAVWPYVGGGLGFHVMDWNIFSLGVLVELPVGFLIALNRSVAIDVGVPISIKLSFRSSTDVINFPLGVIGFRYYFN